MDALSTKRVALLHPKLRTEALDILALCDQALTGRAKVRYTYTLRTDKEQNDLYASGRTVKNPDGVSKQRPMGYKVTNAKAGDSLHNYGLALDFALIIDGKTASWNDVTDYDNDRIADWTEVVAIFKAHGWQWGGDWSSIVDKPHFQKTFGLSVSQLKAIKAEKKFIPGTSYLQIGSVSPKAFKTVTGLNLRSGAGTEFTLIRTLPAGADVVELERNGSWSKIEFGKLIGWVSNKYLN